MMTAVLSERDKVTASKTEEAVERQQLIQECCKHVTYRCYQDGEAICNYGDIGEEYYIVI